MGNPATATLSRRDARREERRGAILDVAEQSFLEHGYAGTTMSGIAQALGGSKGTLWSYFPSKEALFAAVLDRATAEFRARLQPMLATSGDLRGVLHGFCVEFITRVTEPDAIALYRLIVGEVVRFPEIGAIFFARGPGPTQQLLADYIVDAMGRGLLRRGDPQAAARHLTALCMNGSHQQLIFGMLERAGPGHVAEDAQAAMDAFLAAYAA